MIDWLADGMADVSWGGPFTCLSMWMDATCMHAHTHTQAWRRAQQAQQAQTKKNGKKVRAFDFIVSWGRGFDRVQSMDR